jgi:HD-GYP domain-containing protein (c-di-GMP phosphodiesterase class II)
MGVTGEALDEIAIAAQLHDIGKVGIPDAILNKPCPLSDPEWELIRNHTILGERILHGAPALRRAARLVRASHERWDGAGYPDRLRSDEIPLGARIVSVCDAYEAMTTARSYRGADSPERARRELLRCAGAQFDPAVVDAFLAAMDSDADELERDAAHDAAAHVQTLLRAS